MRKFRIGDVRSGCEGRVTRINLKTVEKVWQTERDLGEYTRRNLFKQLKRREKLLPPSVRDILKFVYPFKFVTKLGKTVSYSRFVPGKEGWGASSLMTSDGLSVERELTKVGICDFIHSNVVLHRDKKLYFFDPVVLEGPIKAGRWTRK